MSLLSENPKLWGRILSTAMIILILAFYVLLPLPSQVAARNSWEEGNLLSSKPSEQPDSILADDRGPVFKPVRPAGSVRVLLVSSTIRDADVLASAAAEGVLVVRYEARETTLESLLDQVKEALNGRKAESIGIAAHDYGEAKFYLCGSETISLGSTLSSGSQRAFWKGLSAVLESDGRIDILACKLASTTNGLMLISSLEDAAGVNFAASTNNTGNVTAGGDWILETDNIDVEALYFSKERSC